MALGDHLKVQRPGYQHHGIDAGDGTVIEYDKKSSKVRRVEFSVFQGDASAAQVVKHPHSFPPEEILERALSRMGEDGYDLVRNNCENFATWCCTGVSRSKQVEAVKAAAVGVAATAGLAAARVLAKRAGRA